MKITTKRIALWAGILLLVLSQSGCIYQNVRSPGMRFSASQYQVSSKDYKIVGQVSSEGVTTLWFGAVLTGGEGYSELNKQARRLGGDAIMDYELEVEYTSILMLVYAKAKWKATGKAIRYEDHLFFNGVRK